MNAKKNKSRAGLWGLLALLLIVPLLILMVKRMEGQPPEAAIELVSASLGAEAQVTLTAADAKTGLRQVWVALYKDGKETVLLDQQFPSGNILSGGIVKDKTLTVPVNPKVRGVKDGKAVLRLVARDFSWRKWGKGNQYYKEYTVLIDTQAPRIDVMDTALNLAQGGSGVVVYTLSEECPTSGITVGDHFYPGRSGHFSDPLMHMAFIALDHRLGKGASIVATATDYAGNRGNAGVPHHINARRFKADTINIGDGFLKAKMPEFKDQTGLGGGARPLDVFLAVNQKMREQNYEVIKSVVQTSDATVHWKGAFARLPGAANRAGFADARKYVYRGKTIDRQTHLGIDLASIKQSPIPAANGGKVVFAEYLGIYGRTVMIDHGFGLFSMYAHLSHIAVEKDQMVEKGDTLGKTGKSGLAGGDHLHYSMLVNHTFVNPIEWWDSAWIRNNILAKIDRNS